MIFLIETITNARAMIARAFRILVFPVENVSLPFSLLLLAILAYELPP